MRGRVFKSIAFKMTLLVLGGTALVFATILYFSFEQSKEIIRSRSQDNARNLTAALAERIEQDFKAAEKVAQNVAMFIERGEVNDRDGLVTLALGMVKDNPEINSAAIAFEPYAFDPRARLFAPYVFRVEEDLEYVQLGSAGNDYLRTDWYHIPRVLKKPLWSEPLYEEADKSSIIMYYSYPLFGQKKDQEKSVKGIVSVSITLEWLGQIIAQNRPGRTGYCFIISKYGTVVYHPREAFVMVESVFSLAERYNAEALRRVGYDMLDSPEGVIDYQSAVSPEDSILAWNRIPSPGLTVGAVFPKRELFLEANRLERQTELMAILGIGLLFAVSLVISRSITKPLRLMESVVTKVKAKMTSDKHTEMPDMDLSGIRSNDEVGRLAVAFSELGAILSTYMEKREFIRERYGRFITTAMIEQMVSSPKDLKLGGETREISVLMARIPALPEVGAKMEPKRLAELLNRVTARFVDNLIRFEGVVDDVYRDGIIALFGVYKLTEDHAERAVACALAMQAEISEINAENEKEGLPHLELSAAISAGPVVLGNIGAETHGQDLAEGSPFSLVSRAVAVAAGGQVLVCPSVYESTSDTVTVMKTLTVDMPAGHTSVNIYEVEAIGGPHSVRFKRLEDSPVYLHHPLTATLRKYGVSEDAATPVSVRLVALSQTSVVLEPDTQPDLWDDVEVVFKHTEDDGARTTEIFGKVTDIRDAEGRKEVVVSLASMTAESFRDLAQLATKARVQSL